MQWQLCKGIKKKKRELDVDLHLQMHKNAYENTKPAWQFDYYPPL